MTWYPELKKTKLKKKTVLRPIIDPHRNGRLSPRELYTEINRIFLNSLASGQTIQQSARLAGKSIGCFAHRKKADPKFAADWEEAAAVGAQFEQGTLQKFLDLMTEGLGVNAAARLVGRCLIHLTQRRQVDPVFDQAWETARLTGLKKRLDSLKSIDVGAFLEAIRSGLSVEKASHIQGLPLNYLYFLKRNDPEFADQWAQAMAVKQDLLKKTAPV